MNISSGHVISIITPVHPSSTDYLSNAYKSILAQELPDGWAWEWLVQEDGELGVVRDLLPAASVENGDGHRISYSFGRHGGPGVARTMALSRTSGELVKVLDADDELAPGALRRDIEVLSHNPDVDWTTSRVVDLLPDGSTVGFDNDPPNGLIRRGDVLSHWLSHDHRAQVHPATLCVRREILLMLGGWMALPASEDTGLLLSLNAVSTGYFIEEAGLFYRKWPGQSTASPAHSAPVERTARMRVIEARARRLLNSTSVVRDAVLDSSDPC